MTKKRQEVLSASFKAGKNLTVREYADRWIDNKRGSVASTTIRSHKILTNRACSCEIDAAKHLFGDLKLTAVEPDHVRELQRRLDKDGFSTTTTNSTISEVRSIFKSALIDRIVQFNPALGISPLKRREEKVVDTTHRALTDDEIKRFFEAAKDSWHYNIFRFMIQTGCRCGEAAGLMFEDVHDDMISIRRTVTRDEHGKYILGDTAKTKSGVRDIPLTDIALEVLEDQKKFMIDSMGTEIFEKEHLFFRDSRGQIVSSHSVDVSIKLICKKAGIEKFSSHAFRHTFATRAVEGGMNPKVLQTILGHSDIALTLNLYTHVMDDTKIKEMKDCFHIAM